MANVLNQQDAYAIYNAVATQAMGGTLANVDSSNIVSVGETLLRTGLENTLNAISYVMSKSIFSARPYKQKLASLERGEERFGMITRKITYLRSEAEPSNDYNTQITGYTTQLADGNSIDMYKIKAPKAIQTNFPGAQLYQVHITRFRDQLRVALTNIDEFARFWEACMVEFYNSIEDIKEAKTRVTLVNYIAGKISMSNNVVNLTTAFNTKFSTSYTRAQLLSTYLPDFMKFVAAKIKTDSAAMTDRSTMYHANITGYSDIVRHSPKERQKMVMYEPLFIEAESQVYSALFNPKYLDIGEFEGVNFWQSKATPTSINYTPNILDVSDGEAKTAGAAVTNDYILGMLFDEEALGVMNKFDYASTTPFNSAGGYYNLYVHGKHKSYNDYTENAIVYTV